MLSGQQTLVPSEVFSFNWSLNATERIDRISTIFLTAYNLAFYEWKLKLSSEEDFSFLRGHLTPHFDAARLSFEPNILFESDRTPLLSQFVVHVVAKNDTGEPLFGPSTYRVSPRLNEGDVTIIVPPEKEAGRIIRTVAVGQSGAATLDICVTLHIPKTSFELGKFVHAALAPTKRDFRFAVLDDPSNHDVRLICTNGVFPCNRAALFQTSSYFRRLFSAKRTAVTSNEDCPLEALSTVVTYMLTGTFVRPETMTPRMTEEMVLLIRRYRPAITRSILSALERSACEQLEKEQSNMEQVIKWFLAGTECEMYRLENAALAVLLGKHMNDFAMDFIVKERGCPAWRDLHERLNRRRTIFRNEPMQKIIRCRRQKVDRFEKFVC